MVLGLELGTGDTGRRAGHGLSLAAYTIKYLNGPGCGRRLVAECL